MLRGVTRQAFFLFLSFGESVLRFAQWLRYRSPPAIFPDVVADTDLCLQAGSGGETTCRLLSVLDGDLEYLSREEADNIITRFEGIPSSLDRLLFWTGLPREWAQRWADEHGMLTLTSAMGPLMDTAHPQCLKRKKKGKDWSRYVKGASSIFSRYACTCGVVRVLTVPPSETLNISFDRRAGVERSTWLRPCSKAQIRTSLIGVQKHRVRGLARRPHAGMARLIRQRHPQLHATACNLNYWEKEEEKEEEEEEEG
jgi:hypothetical protein